MPQMVSPQEPEYSPSVPAFQTSLQVQSVARKQGQHLKSQSPAAFLLHVTMRDRQIHAQAWPGAPQHFPAASIPRGSRLNTREKHLEVGRICPNSLGSPFSASSSPCWLLGCSMSIPDGDPKHLHLSGLGDTLLSLIFKIKSEPHDGR